MILNVHFTFKVHFKRLNMNILYNIFYRILNLFGAKIKIETIEKVANPKFCYLPTRLLNGTTSWLELVDRDTINQSKWVAFATAADKSKREIPIGDLVLHDNPIPLLDQTSLDRLFRTLRLPRK